MQDQFFIFRKVMHLKDQHLNPNNEPKTELILGMPLADTEAATLQQS